MSREAEALTWKRARVGKTDLLMLVKIADLTDDDGRNCWAEVPHLARACRASIRAAQYTLLRLEACGEIEIEYNDGGREIVLRGGRTFRPKWFIHVRCVCDWDAYQDDDLEEYAEVAHSARRGRPKRKSAKAAHSARRIKRNIRHDKAQLLTSKCAETRSGDIEVPLNDPVTEQVQADAAAKQALRARPDAEKNVKVLTKLAHEVLDLLSETPDVTLGEVTETIKRHAAVLHIAYNSEVITKGIDSACYQRRRAGKKSVIPYLSGDSAARLEGYD